METYQTKQANNEKINILRHHGRYTYGTISHGEDAEEKV
jgi:hypothetical protein